LHATRNLTGRSRSDTAHLGHKTEQLEHEARIVSKLQHPNIITLFHTGEARRLPLSGLRLCRGKNARANWLKTEKTLPLVRGGRDSLRCAGRSCLRALAGCVTSGCKTIQRDDCQEWRGDGDGFRAGKNSQSPGNTNQCDAERRTPRYMAPELISGKQIAFMADIYSVGAMLYEM